MMMFNLLSKILAGVSATLLIVCLVFYAQVLGKNHTISVQESKISALETNNKVLKNRVEVCQSMCKAGIEAKEIQTGAIDDLRKTETTLLEKLAKLEGENEKKDEVDRGSVVPPDRSRMLNLHCERIRGSPCPDP